MDEKRQLSEDVYHRVPNDENSKIRNFIIYYKNYVNVPLYNSDKKQFLNILKSVGESVGKIDVQRNILIICDKDINREVFLHLFSLKERLSSNRYMNAPELYDIFWEKSTRDNVRLDSDEVFYSTQNIREDVLCMFICNEQYVHGVGPILSSVIDSRYNKFNTKRENLITWVFYRGTVADIKSDRDYSNVYDLFKKKNDSDSYLILDLNTGNTLSGIPSMGSTRTNNNSVSQSLGDIY